MSTAERSLLEAHLGYLMRRVSNRVSDSFAKSLAERGVSVSEWVCLVQISEHPRVTPSALAGMIGMTQGAISKVSDKLLAKGWIESIDNETDHRGRFLSLTDHGREVLPELCSIADANDARIFQPLSGRDQAELRRLLTRLSQIHGWDEVPIK